jgi:hypothetical protein
VAPECRREDAETACFLVMHLGESTMRLALSVGPEEGKRLVEAYKGLALREVRRAGTAA